MLHWLNEWFHHINWIQMATIPVFTGVIGWLINWSGLWMLFSPVHFHGWNVPGLKAIIAPLPRKIHEVPGLPLGKVGWQGIVPARAAKMGSIAVDKAIAKLGTPKEFFQQLEPDKIAEHIVTIFEPQLPVIVDQIMQDEHPRLWNDIPAPLKAAMIDRVQGQLPTIVSRVTDQIGDNIDELLDPKLMVIDHFREHPELVVRIFRDFGAKELRLMVVFGFIFGFLLGVPVAVIDSLVHDTSWRSQLVWLLPVMGIFVGWTTNLLGMWLIFDPAEPRYILGIKVQGLFPRRQSEAAEVYADLIAAEVITLERIGDFLMDGPHGDATKRLLGVALAPVVDQAIGFYRPAAWAIMGKDRYARISASVAQEAADRTLMPFRDAEFSQKQAGNIQRLVAQRTRELPPADFVDMMRSAIKEDEWMLYAHGAIMGLAGGFLHLALFGIG